MSDWITITRSPGDWAVLQQYHGEALFSLEGEFSRSSHKSEPVLNAWIENTGQPVCACLRPVIDGNRWHCELRLPVGVYRIEAGLLLEQTGLDPRYLGRGAVLRGVGVGEVFVVAGQSNAVGYARQPADDPTDVRVRMLGPGGWTVASHPIGFVSAPLDAANVDIILPGHSPWLRFGRGVADATGGPVGIIQTGRNGASIDEWRPGSPLRGLLEETLRSANGAHLIWYQGCTDTCAGRSRGYARKLLELLKAIQDIAGALYLVQISGQTTPGPSPEEWVAVREAQRATAAELECPLIPTWDLNRYADGIHLGAHDNFVLADRLLAAYAGKSVPFPVKAIRKEGCLEILLSDAAIVLRLPEFTVLDVNGRPVWSGAGMLEGTCIRLPDPGAQARTVRPLFDVCWPEQQEATMEQCLAYFSIEIQSI